MGNGHVLPFLAADISLNSKPSGIRGVQRVNGNIVAIDNWKLYVLQRAAAIRLPARSQCLAYFMDEGPSPQDLLMNCTVAETQFSGTNSVSLCLVALNMVQAPSKGSLFRVTEQLRTPSPWIPPQVSLRTSRGRTCSGIGAQQGPSCGTREAAVSLSHQTVSHSSGHGSKARAGPPANIPIPTKKD